MIIEDYKRLIARMKETHPSDKAVILITMDCAGDIHTATFGDPEEVDFLRKKIGGAE